MPRERKYFDYDLGPCPDFSRGPVKNEDKGSGVIAVGSEVVERESVPVPMRKSTDSRKDVVVHFKGVSARVLNQFVIHRSISEGQIVQKSKLVDEAVLFYIKKTEPELYSRLKSEGLIKK